MSSLASFFLRSDQKQNDKNKRYDVLDGLANLSYHERLTSFLRGSTRHWVAGGVTVVDFRPLYSVTLHHLQRQLAGEIEKVGKHEVTDQQLKDLRETLHQYTDALRDFEFIHANRWNTQFVKDISASRIDNGGGSKLQQALISDLGLKANDTYRSLFRDSDLLGSFDPELMEHSTAIGQSLGTDRARTVASEERRAHFLMAWKRFAFAIIGGLIIVVPMLILVVGSATTKSLAVIPTSIFLFAVGVAIFAKTDPTNLLAATAAYAAVLVALIGDGRQSVP
ncbi:hypothetical protein BDV96DRAFT_654136 [Lophiotrema nucula]|uniref:DUF6594 domain-containing protein n=1 Tax=Lophiotrema nucula TaxID=690887 RepID=A0A6A5YIX9_9PLEO|nr:hypothetical protein BDV96DRAFT_654136 [Lophiotrema nucula]